MKRKRARERDEADAREAAEARRAALLAELRARQGPVPPPGAAAPEVAVTPPAGPGDLEADPEPAAEPE